MDGLEDIIAEIGRRCAAASERGTPASYIPKLGQVDPGQFGLVAVTADGREIAVGDADQAFSMQSIVKVFALTRALERIGDVLWQRVGREPSGDPFNSIVQLEHKSGVPRNPFINPGAIVVMDILQAGTTAQASIDDLLGFLREASGDFSIAVDPEVAESEDTHGARNRAMAHFIAAFRNLDNDPEEVLHTYFNACAVSITCRQLAWAGRYLAWDGLTGPNGRRVAASATARRTNALMLTCGHYDGSGEFAFRVGMPGKSGVGGGILAVVPGYASIACWSPGLDVAGNSKIATEALEELAERTGWSVFASQC